MCTHNIFCGEMRNCINILQPFRFLLSVSYSTGRSRAVVPVLVLLFVALLFILTRRFVLCLTLCHFVLVFYSPFGIATTSLGEERANLSAFRTFVWCLLVWICRVSLPLGVWEGLRFVIVASLDFSLTFFAGVLRVSCKQKGQYQ